MSLRNSRAVAVALVSFAAFTDLVAYSIAVPVLPDLSRRFGASPTMIGLLFASFGLTLLGVSIPIGSVSDRIGRKGPMVGGLIVLMLSTVLFAFADSLPWLFAARLAQGAADAVTWVVGFALIADLYGPAERGRVMGFVMSGTSFGLMIGPSLGGWLYETGGMRLPFLTVAGLAAAAAIGFLWLRPPETHAAREAVPLRQLLRVRAVAICALTVVVAASTAAMLEPAVSLWLSSDLNLNPSRVGVVFGVAAVAATALHPVFGRLADRWGGRRLTMIGLVVTALMMPLLSRAWNFESAIGFYVLDGHGPGARRDAVARLHGRSDLGGGRRIVRRLVRGLQLCVGNGAAGRPGDRRVSLRAARICAPHAGVDATCARNDHPAGSKVRLEYCVPSSGVSFGGLFMTRVRIAAVLTAAFLACAAQSISADVKADERGHVKFEGGLGRVVNIFGGKAAREGVKSTVAVKGDRKITTNDVNGQIVDLAEEKIYDLDIKKKTYTVTTFADCGGGWRRRARRPRPSAKKAQEKPAEAPPDQNAKEMEVDFTVKETGQRKTINGFDTASGDHDDHVPREGQDAGAGRRPRRHVGHLAGAADRSDAGSGRVRAPLCEGSSPVR